MPLDTEENSYESLLGDLAWGYRCGQWLVTPFEPDSSCVVMKIEYWETWECLKKK